MPNQSLPAFLYARVSSKDQEREGYSIPAQLELLRSYAAAHGFAAAAEFVDVETAKAAGRTGFGQMVARMRRDSSCRVVLVEKTDRLYRNLKDWVTVDDLGVEIHFVKEGVVLSADSRSSEKFMHGIKVLMAKNYIDNLSEESRKGMLEKARQGIWPSFAPLGYQNVMGADGKRTIAPDPDLAPMIKRLFELYASGRYSLKQLAKTARADGLVYRKSGASVPTSTVHKILTNRIYSGDFDFDGRTYAGAYEPLVSRELWQRVQEVLKGRGKRKTRQAKHRFAFSRLITCGHCGSAVVGDAKKGGRYVYYRCSQCRHKYTPEAQLERQFAHLLSQLRFDEDVLRCAEQAIHAARKDESETVARLQRERQRIEQRLEAMYVDKLDGKIDEAFYERKADEFRAEQQQLDRDIEAKRQPEVDVRALAARIPQLFAQATAEQKHRMLECLITGSKWADGQLEVEWRKPFGQIAAGR